MTTISGASNPAVVPEAQNDVENNTAAKTNKGTHSGREVTVTANAAPAMKPFTPVAASSQSQTPQITLSPNAPPKPPRKLPEESKTLPVPAPRTSLAKSQTPPIPAPRRLLAAQQAAQKIAAEAQATVDDHTESAEIPPQAKPSRGVRNFARKQIRSLMTNIRNRKAKVGNAFLQPVVIANPAYEAKPRPGNPDINLKLENFGKMLTAKLNEFEAAKASVQETAGSKAQKSRRGISSWLASSSKPSVKTLLHKMTGTNAGSLDLTAADPKKTSANARSDNDQGTAKDIKKAAKTAAKAVKAAEANVTLLSSYKLPNT